MGHSNAETLHHPESVGLYDLLASPERIIQLDQQPQKLEIITPEQWHSVYQFATNIYPLLLESIERERQYPETLYVVETGADNGILYSYRSTKDATITATIYVSSFGITFDDWEKGLTIKPDRVKCHQVQITTRKQVSPTIHTASQFQFRTTPDFQLIEGDPEQKAALLSRGLLSDNETYFSINTRFHFSFIEMFSSDTAVKSLMPLIHDVSKFWQVVLDAENADILSRYLTGNLKQYELDELEQLSVSFGGLQAIDIAKFWEIAAKIAKDCQSGAASTIRGVPLSNRYIAELAQLPLVLEPVPFDTTFLPAKTFDILGIGKKKYLQKRADKYLGKWTLNGDTP